MLRKPRFAGLFTCAMACLLTTAHPSRLEAEPVAFSGWTHQKFNLLRGGNSWRQAGQQLSVASDGTVSLLWRAVPQSSWQASTASWTWSVESGVPPTDLSRKGGDDRNLALYFIFAPQDVAAASEGLGIRKLFDNPDVRVLMYVWGGGHQRGAVLQSPYLGARGKTIVLRPAAVGSFDEKVDFRADVKRIYDRTNLALVGVAVSADSDDTGSRIRARVSNLDFSR
jgi:hypothetical protein